MQLNPKGDHLAALLLFPFKGIFIPRHPLLRLHHHRIQGYTYHHLRQLHICFYMSSTTISSIPLHLDTEHPQPLRYLLDKSHIVL